MKKIVLVDSRLNHGELRYEHLLGREFVLGRTDCYAIARDLFGDNLDIELADYARPNDFWLEDMNLYVDNFKREGFALLDEPSPADIRPFDVFLIAIPDTRDMSRVVTNHCAVYLGDGMVIHHRLGTLSTVTPYRTSLKNLTTHVIRHKDVPNFNAVKEVKLDSMEFILPHKKEKLMGALNELNRRDQG